MPGAYRSYLDYVHWGEKTCPPWVSPFPGWHPECTNGGREGSGSMHSPLFLHSSLVMGRAVSSSPLPWFPCRNGAHPQTVSKNKLLPEAALVRIVSHSVTKETKAVGTLDSLLDHFCSRERSFNHHGQGQKETTREQRQSIRRETPWIKK